MAPLERQRELAVIEDVVARAAEDGRGSVVLLEGPAAIGKSAVLDEARRRADRAVRQLGARAGTLEREFGFGVVRQLLEAAAREREIPDAAQAVLTDVGGPQAGPSSEGGFAVLHGLLWVVLDLAEERPLLLTVDDLQWADRPSLRFLAYLARRIEELPVLLLATIRTGEPDADEDLLDAVRQVPSVSLPLAPLSPQGVGGIVAERLGEQPEDAFVAACHTATGGNPLLVRELVAGLELDGVRPVASQADVVRSIGPRAVSRTVASRLARLEPAASATARAVAILGDGVAVPVAARFAGLDEASVAEATGSLARADILRPEPPLAFVHPLVADAVVAALPPGERELQHGLPRLLFETAARLTAPVCGTFFFTSALRNFLMASRVSVRCCDHHCTNASGRCPTRCRVGQAPSQSGRGTPGPSSPTGQACPAFFGRARERCASPGVASRPAQ